MIPDGRTADYLIFRICERWGFSPPFAKPDFEENTPHMQARLIAYEQIRQHEEATQRMANGLV